MNVLTHNRLAAKAWALPALVLASPLALAAGMDTGNFLNTIIYLVIVALVFWVIWWFLGYVGVPEPFNKVIRVLLGLAALLVVVNVLLSLIGKPIF